MRFALCLVLLFAFRANCQELNKTYLDQWVMECDTTAKLRDINLYVVSGVPYAPDDSLKLNVVLKTLGFKNLAGIDYIKSDEMLPTTGNPGKYVVIISSKLIQKAVWKRKALNETKSKYPKPGYYETHFDMSLKEPVLVINDKMIFHADCYEALKKIETNNVSAIDICIHSVPSKYYGTNAKNGLIQIWTYKKK